MYDYHLSIDTYIVKDIMIINPLDNPPAITRQYYICGKVSCLPGESENFLNGGEGIATRKPYDQRSEGKYQAEKASYIASVMQLLHWNLTS